MAENATASRLAPERVASYETLDGAARAVSHLIELDYSANVVAIAPARFQAVDNDPLPRRIWSGLRNGSIVGLLGAALYTVVALADFSDLLGVLIPAAIVAIPLAAFCGISAVVLKRLIDDVRSCTPMKPRTVPTRFDVIVQREQHDARHDLARWWDPDAPVTRGSCTSN